MTRLGSNPLCRFRPLRLFGPFWGHRKDIKDKKDVEDEEEEDDHPIPTGTVGSPPSSTHTHPYCVLLGEGFLR